MHILKLSLFLSMTLFVSLAESKEITSLNSHEGKLIKCLNTISSNNKCISSLIKNHLPNGNKSLFGVADKVEGIFIQWLAKEKIANVYKIEDRNIGDFMIYRNYIVEDKTASIILFEITYRKALGKWYVLKFNLNSKPAYISQKLKY